MVDLAVAIAADLEADIRAGRLRPGERLPTHRALAETRSVAVNTATRAMQLLANRGLTVGEVGRGSFVRAPAQADAAEFRLGTEAEGILDLSRNAMPVPGLAARFYKAAVAILRREPGLAGYQPHAGRDEDRAAGAAWLARDGLLPNDPGRVVVCAGSQHATFLALLAVCRPGDTIAVEALTWPGIKAAAAALHLRVVAVPLDEGGLRPRALLRVASRHKIAALYCMPTVQNPTSAVMSVRRREMVVALARRLDFQIIESDVYGWLAGDAAAPLAALAPERTWLVCGTSKAFAPGLRCAWLFTPDQARRAADLVRATVWVSPSLGAAIASRWVADGTAVHLVRAKRAEAEARQALAAQLLPAGWRRQTHPISLHLWLHLPAILRSDEAAQRALELGVRVALGAAFAVGRVPNAVRLSLGAPERRDDLEHGLRTLCIALGS